MPEPTELRDVVAETLALHRLYRVGVGGPACTGCFWLGVTDSEEPHRYHVTSMVLAALAPHHAQMRKGRCFVEDHDGAVEQLRVLSRDYQEAYRAGYDAALAEVQRQLSARAEAHDAPDVWDDTTAPGGNVCAACREPVETQPCRAHQPLAWARMEGETG